MKISTLLVCCLITSFFGAAQTNYFTAQVSASENDAEENKSNGSIDLTSSDIEMCYDEGVLGIGAKNQFVGLRFTSIDVPKNALIDSVFIQ